MRPVPVYVKRGNEVFFDGYVEELAPKRDRQPSRPTLADEVIETGPEFTLQSYLVERIREPKVIDPWFLDEQPSSWRDRSWKCQTGVEKQYLRRPH